MEAQEALRKRLRALRETVLALATKRTIGFNVRCPKCSGSRGMVVCGLGMAMVTNEPDLDQEVRLM